LSHLRKISILLALVGLLLGTLLVGWFGFAHVLDAVLSVSLAGFTLLCGWQMVLFFVNGAAWDVTMPGLGWRRLGVIVWGRMVRDSAGNCLPFSQLGGYIAGIRAVTTLGITPLAATASTVVDLTAEFLAQIVFAAQGMLILLAHGTSFSLAVPMTIALAIALGTCVVFIWMQRRGISPLAGLSRRIAGNRFSGAQDSIDALQAELTEIYKTPRGVVLSFAIHWIGWIGTAIGGWIAFQLLGVPITLIDALAIEGLLHAVLAMAFLVPGYAGIQEVAYAGIGSLFGLPPEIAIAVSLLRRSRDIAVGIPILIVWQLIEVRKLRLKVS
jgi:putative membrane protein